MYNKILLYQEKKSTEIDYLENKENVNLSASAPSNDI